MKEKKITNTSWEKVSSWYDKLVGHNGHYYHRHVIIPGLLKILSQKKPSSLLDLACGSGILSQNLSTSIDYYGLDISPSLIASAKRNNKKNSKFFITDVTDKTLKNLKKTDFDVATVILALQDIGLHDNLFKNCHFHLKDQGSLILVINHPCFRIPRQSSWCIDKQKKEQKRQVNRYMTEMKIPIQTSPSKKNLSEELIFHHYPLSTYFLFLQKNGFIVESVHEWTSNKTSEGKYKQMENRSRKEFPLFLCIIAKKISSNE